MSSLDNIIEPTTKRGKITFTSGTVSHVLSDFVLSSIIFIIKNTLLKMNILLMNTNTRSLTTWFPGRRMRVIYIRAMT